MPRTTVGDLCYRVTTMVLIAERVHEAVQTVDFTFRTKDALLQEAHGQTVLGRGDLVTPNAQPWYLEAVAEADPARAMHLLVDGVSTILA